MKCFLYLAFLALSLTACNEPSMMESQAPPTPPADAVASWRGGSLSLAEIEERLPAQRTPACQAMRKGGGQAEDILPCYREVTETLVVERLVMAEVDDLDAAVDELLAAEPERHREALLGLFYQRLGEATEVSNEEIEDHFEAHRDDYRTPAHLSLWNIFRRHEDPDHPEATLEFLNRLRSRALAGENFATLAREYSHSETRLRDGQVGDIREGDLPTQVEEIVFALDDGGISEPFPVKRGAILLQARHKVAASEPSLDDVRGRIFQQLRARKVTETVETRLADRQPPTGSLVLTESQLITALDEKAEDSPAILEVGDERLDAEDMRRLLGLPSGERATELEPDERQQVADAYQHRLERQLLFLQLLESEDPVDVELRAEAERQTREAAATEVLERKLREGIDDHLDGTPERLLTYFEDNRSLFQSPLRFELSLWSLPFDDEAALQLTRMEDLRRALVAGEIELAAAADRLGGSLSVFGWRNLAELPREIPLKARSYLLQTPAGSFSVIYQNEDAHQLLWVQGREEPRPFGYEEAAEQIRRTYRERFGQQLYSELVDARLEAAGFQFNEQTVRRLLGA